MSLESGDGARCALAVMRRLFPSAGGLVTSAEDLDALLVDASDTFRLGRRDSRALGVESVGAGDRIVDSGETVTLMMQRTQSGSHSSDSGLLGGLGRGLLVKLPSRNSGRGGIGGGVGRFRGGVFRLMVLRVRACRILSLLSMVRRVMSTALSIYTASTWEEDAR